MKKNLNEIGIINKQGYILNKKNLTEKQINKIKTDLTIAPDTEFDDDTKSFQIYQENEENIILPRYYGIKEYGYPKTNIKQIKGVAKLDITFEGRLRDYQEPVIAATLKAFETVGGGLLHLYCGAGKTTIALYLACVLKLKTLILVHKSFLQDQWYDRIKTFTNAKIGIIRQNKIDVENKDIIIGMVQSISKKNYDPRIFEDIDVLISDETHRMACRCFSKALMKIRPKYTLGLSATPYRKDGLTKVINWFLGDVIYKLDRKEDTQVNVKLFNYESKNPLFIEKKRWIKGQMRVDTQKMITNIYQIESRNKFIVNIINSIRKQNDRKILVLSGRLEHLKNIKKRIDDILKQDIDTGILEEDEIKTSFYIGGMKDYLLRDASEADIIFATYEMAAEGLDIDGLNTLVLATPKKDIIQSIGRIMRKPIEERDVDPLVIDIIDDLSLFASWGSNRKKYYESKKYTTELYHAIDDKCISVMDYLIYKKILKEYTPEIDIKHKYICAKYDEALYELEKEVDFPSFPETMFNANITIDTIFPYGNDIEI